MKYPLFVNCFVAANILAATAAWAQSKSEPVLNDPSGSASSIKRSFDALDKPKSDENSRAIQYRLGRTQGNIDRSSEVTTGPRINDEMAKEKMKNQMLNVLESSKMDMLKQANEVPNLSTQGNIDRSSEVTTGLRINDEMAKEKMKNQMLNVLESSKMDMLKQANEVPNLSTQK